MKKVIICLIQTDNDPSTISEQAELLKTGAKNNNYSVKKTFIVRDTHVNEDFEQIIKFFEKNPKIPTVLLKETRKNEKTLHKIIGIVLDKQRDLHILIDINKSKKISIQGSEVKSLQEKIIAAINVFRKKRNNLLQFPSTASLKKHTKPYRFTKVK